MFSENFNALNKEGQFTKEMLGAGATQIRGANYATKGVYFQAFTSLSTGLERIGKLCLMVDYYIDRGKFPDFNYVKNDIGHDIIKLYERAKDAASHRGVEFEFLRDLDDNIHQSIMRILSDFAIGDRYSNINLVIGAKRKADPVASWHVEVDEPLYQTCVSARRKETIKRNATIISALLSNHCMVQHTSETGRSITDLEDASSRSGMFEAVAPYRQLYVVQIIRYWVELLTSLQYVSMRSGGRDIPYFSEVFAPFYNADSYIIKRKTWDKV